MGKVPRDQKKWRGQFVEARLLESCIVDVLEAGGGGNCWVGGNPKEGIWRRPTREGVWMVL